MTCSSLSNGTARFLQNRHSGSDGTTSGGPGRKMLGPGRPSRSWLPAGIPAGSEVLSTSPGLVTPLLISEAYRGGSDTFPAGPTLRSGLVAGAPRWLPLDPRVLATPWDQADPAFRRPITRPGWHVCRACFETFWPAPGSRHQVYCSGRCRDRAAQRRRRAALRAEPEPEPVEHACAICGRTFVATGVNRKRRRFCSARCNARASHLAALARRRAAT